MKNVITLFAFLSLVVLGACTKNDVKSTERVLVSVDTLMVEHPVTKTFILVYDSVFKLSDGSLDTVNAKLSKEHVFSRDSLYEIIKEESKHYVPR